ncbi:hypothetical protein TcCL_NonESM06171, partial [Trypanosoma cruzi]
LFEACGGKIVSEKAGVPKNKGVRSAGVGSLPPRVAAARRAAGKEEAAKKRPLALPGGPRPLRKWGRRAHRGTSGASRAKHRDPPAPARQFGERNATPSFQARGTNSCLAAHASNTAVADGLFAQRESALAGSESHLETTPAQPQAQPQERMARKARTGALARLGVPIRPDGEEFPLPGKGRQMRSRTGPRMAHRHRPTTSV